MKPRLLDLFCGAGGAARGYQLAGFHVTGVDIAPQPHYCGDEFAQADALTFPLKGFDAIHASPPCQFFSSATGRNGRRERHVDLITPMRPRLVDAGLPYVIENVEMARAWMRGPYTICGSSFGLDLRRHRLFETNFPMMVLPCAHHWQRPRFPALDGNRGDREGYTPVASRSYLARVVGVHGHLNYPGEGPIRERAMGIGWMTQEELTQAIPPAYTEHVGGYLMAAVQREVPAC